MPWQSGFVREKRLRIVGAMNKDNYGGSGSKGERRYVQSLENTKEVIKDDMSRVKNRSDEKLMCLIRLDTFISRRNLIWRIHFLRFRLRYHKHIAKHGRVLYQHRAVHLE